MWKMNKGLEMGFVILHKWFHENHMVLNPGKCYYIVIGDDDPSHKIIFNNNEIASSNEEKILLLHLFVKKQAKNMVLLQE